MRWILSIATFVVAVGLGLSAGAEEEAIGAQKCLKAEINPVTGHTYCLDPRGAPVEAAPQDWLEPCKTGPDASAANKAAKGDPWTFRPNCVERSGQG